MLAHRGSFNSNDNPAALLLTPEAQDSHFFNSMPRSVVANLQKLPIAMENHQQGTPRLACRAPANAVRCKTGRGGLPLCSILLRVHCLPIDHKDNWGKPV